MKSNLRDDLLQIIFKLDEAAMFLEHNHKYHQEAFSICAEQEVRLRFLILAMLEKRKQEESVYATGG